jgi:hypothetical protein
MSDMEADYDEMTTYTHSRGDNDMRPTKQEMERILDDGVVKLFIANVQYGFPKQVAERPVMVSHRLYGKQEDGTPAHYRATDLTDGEEHDLPSDSFVGLNVDKTLTDGLFKAVTVMAVEGLLEEVKRMQINSGEDPYLPKLERLVEAMRGLLQ